jgi:chromosome segregation ATPase
MNLEKLKLLETRIDEILTQHSAVCQERDRLKQQLSEAESRAVAAIARLAEQESERAEIKSRVERILDRLDGLGLS